MTLGTFSHSTMLHPDLRINSYGHYLRQHFGCRVSKVNVDAGFTCPNRDGSKGVGGCIYCNNVSFSPNGAVAAVPLATQLATGIAYHRQRLGSEKFIAYFQKYTNTYAAVEQLEDLYQAALQHPDVLGVSVGTRPDCLSDEAVALLTTIARESYVCLELGLQSFDDAILGRINRGHSVQDFIDAVERATDKGFDICAHLIYGFPGDEPAAFVEGAHLINRLTGITSVKLHQLHVVEGTALAQMYRQGSFSPVDLEEYVTTVVSFIEHLRPDISIQRLYGSSPLDIRVAPQWGLKNNQMWYTVIKELLRRNSYQGILYKES